MGDSVMFVANKFGLWSSARFSVADMGDGGGFHVDGPDIAGLTATAEALTPEAGSIAVSAVAPAPGLAADADTLDPTHTAEPTTADALLADSSGNVDGTSTAASDTTPADPSDGAQIAGMVTGDGTAADAS